MTEQSRLQKITNASLSSAAIQTGVMQRKCACGSHTVAGGECSTCGKEKNRLQRKAESGGTSSHQRPAIIQAKLTVGASNDPLEHEADRVADQVMSTSAYSAVSHLSPPRIQRASDRSSGNVDDAAPRSVENVLASPGSSLEPACRNEMEHRFRHDFSQVRVHTGTAAEQSARDVRAQAYTVGSNIVFDKGRFAPRTFEGQKLLAHELSHVVQQSSGSGSTLRMLQRTPAAPATAAGVRAPFDRSKVDVLPITDVRTDTSLQELMAMAKVGFVTFNDPAILSYSSVVYDPVDSPISAPNTAAIPASRAAMFSLFGVPVSSLKEGRHTLRCVGYDAAGEVVAYADRSFYVWKRKPTGKPPDIAALEAEKATHEATTKVGSGKTIGEVGSAFTKLKDVTHDLDVLEKGTGTHVGNQCAVQPAGAIHTDCTDFVMEVLRDTFAQQGRAADWEKVEKKAAKNIKARGGKKGLSGVDVQAALQSEAGWKAIYWAPDPQYQVPKAQLSGARSDEAGYTAGIAKTKGTYMKDFGKKGYPGLKISHSVTNYAPEAPNVGHGTASTTVKDTTQLDKLKKLPFGVLSAHGGFHMTLITYGKVIEVHWNYEATNIDLIQQTDLERWAVGPASGFHYYASGAIVAPAADVDAAFK